MNWDWFVGFLEGEGNFSVCFHQIKNKGRTYIQIKFAITIAQKGAAVLKKIKYFLAKNGIESKIYSSTCPKHSGYVLRIVQNESLSALYNALKDKKFECPQKFKEYKFMIRIYNKNKQLKNISYLNRNNFNKYFDLYKEVFNQEKKSNQGRPRKYEISEKAIEEILNSNIKSYKPSHTARKQPEQL